MPPRKPPALAIQEPTPVEKSQLVESVDRLTREVQSMRSELDEAREEIAWAMRTLLPGKAGELSSSDSQPSERECEEMERMMTFVAEGQIEVLLVALDGVRDEIIKAVRGKWAKAGAEPREAMEVGERVDAHDSPRASAITRSESAIQTPTPSDSTGISSPKPPQKGGRPKPQSGQLF